MVRGIDDLDEAVRAAVRPAWSEIVRAKKAIREILADGQPHGIRTIQRILILADGIPPEPSHGEKLQIASADDIDRVVTASEPLIARPRLAWAATEGLLDLVALGIAIEASESPTHEEGNPMIGPGAFSVDYQLGPNGGAIRVPGPLPNLTRAYRLAPHVGADATQWFTDPDLFTADLEQLRLDARACRCLVEALAAYRHGLFLACASLLGAASEGAWYAAGEQLRHLNTQLARAHDDGNTSKVIARVGEVLRQHSGLRVLVDDLHAQAALFRQLRNYGVHPRPSETGHLERYFSDSGAAMLLLETYTYLSRLTGAVAACIANEEATGG